MNAAVDLENIVSRVCARLRSKRVAFLWHSAPVCPDAVPGFTWVHYADDAPAYARCYRLKNLPCPLTEGRTMDMLVVPDGPVRLLAEAVCGLPASRDAALLEGALRASVPVLFGAFSLGAWRRLADTASKERLGAAMHALRGRGVVFFGDGETAQNDAATAGDGTLVLGAGWYSWPELSSMLEGVREVRVPCAARLTMEAAERLAKLNIRVTGGLV